MKGPTAKQTCASRFAGRCTAIGAALLLTACAASLAPETGPTSSLTPPDAGTAEQKKPKAAKIAMLLPLGGFDQTALIAKSMKQAGEMALFELDNPSVQIIVKDDKGSAEGARVAAEEAIRDGAEIILGPLFSQAVAGAAPAARQANIPIIAFSNDPLVAGNGVYLMSFLAQQEVDRIVSFAASQGKRRFAALIPDDAYGRTVEPAFRAAVSRAGGTIAQLELYPVQANAMLEPAKRVAAAIQQGEAAGQPVDALFLPGGQDVLPNFGPLFSYAGIDTTKVKLLGTGGWEYPNIGREDAFIGGWYPGPDPRGWRGFSERFAKTFGIAPPRIASLAYDAVSAAVALSTGPAPGRYAAANLTRPNGFSGVDGMVRLLPDGRSERSLAILEVQKFGSTVVDAPSGTPGARVSDTGQRVN